MYNLGLEGETIVIYTKFINQFLNILKICHDDYNFKLFPKIKNEINFRDSEKKITNRELGNLVGNILIN